MTFIKALPLLEDFLQGTIYAGACSLSKSYPLSNHQQTILSPVTGKDLGNIAWASKSDLQAIRRELSTNFMQWRCFPAPKRAMFIQEIARLVRIHKKSLAQIITLEVGKTVQEAEGEVQEWIDICDFSIGLSRQLYGLTIASERPDHRMMEQWHPLGVVGVISAFNFPIAVWAWNAMIALVCGDCVLWKPSEKTPLCSLACMAICREAIKAFPDYPQEILGMAIGDAQLGQELAEDKNIPLVSATGSVAMGRDLAQKVAKRLGRSLLELSGNNALIVTPSADIKLALRAIVFAAVGTSGQRCTSLRRLIVHQSMIKEVSNSLIKAYRSLAIGDPRNENSLLGPLIDQKSYKDMQKRLRDAEEQGGQILYGGIRLTENLPKETYYVQPALVQISAEAACVNKECFAPILYIMEYEDLEEAIHIQNNVSLGLSSAIFTNDIREAELFISPTGSDCGIANINIGTSGAEIGGAFGGEKDTGGGRESGSDAWKNYMRRATNTVNYGKSLPLAQGINFEL